MKVLKEEITQLIDLILQDTHTHQAVLRGQPKAEHVTARGLARWVTESANDPLWRSAKRGGVPVFLLHTVDILLGLVHPYAKNCANSARYFLEMSKLLSRDKRKRAALAACFISFFSLFPSDTHSANLSTAP